MENGWVCRRHVFAANKILTIRQDAWGIRFTETGNREILIVEVSFPIKDLTINYNPMSGFFSENEEFTQGCSSLSDQWVKELLGQLNA